MFGFGKGKIKIDLNRHQFSPGDSIEGKVNLKMKKTVEADGLFVRFYGVERVSSYHGGRRHSRYQTIFDSSHKLDGDTTWKVGESNYSFKIDIPMDVYTKPSGAMGNVVKSIQLLTGSRSSVKWYVQVYLDIPRAIDVSKKVRININ